MNLFQLASNFTESVAEWVKQGAPVVTEEQFKKRADLCNGCEFFDKEAFAGKGRCLKCGCSTFKLFLATSSCPINKWGKEN
jgi:hypothetical protein